MYSVLSCDNAIQSTDYKCICRNQIEIPFTRIISFFISIFFCFYNYYIKMLEPY